jgi:hypothetical protein
MYFEKEKKWIFLNVLLFNSMQALRQVCSFGAQAHTIERERKNDSKFPRKNTQ